VRGQRDYCSGGRWCVFLGGLFKKIKKFKFGTFLRGAIGTAVPPLKKPLDAGAAVLKKARQGNKNVNDQVPAAIQAGLNEAESGIRNKGLMQGLLIGGALLLVVMLLRRK